MSSTRPAAGRTKTPTCAPGSSSNVSACMSSAQTSFRYSSMLTNKGRPGSLEKGGGRGNKYPVLVAEGRKVLGPGIL